MKTNNVYFYIIGLAVALTLLTNFGLNNYLELFLFLKTDIGNFNGYSKSCPSNVSKQPVILTDKEKEYIDNKDGEYGIKSYDEHITYGSSDKNKNHYNIITEIKRKSPSAGLIRKDFNLCLWILLTCFK